MKNGNASLLDLSQHEGCHHIGRGLCLFGKGPIITVTVSHDVGHAAMSEHLTHGGRHDALRCPKPLDFVLAVVVVVVVVVAAAAVSHGLVLVILRSVHQVV